MSQARERIYNGLIKENPTFVLMLGMCPTLAVTTSAINGLGMGLTTMAVLALSNLFISLLRRVIPVRVRIPAFIVVIASFVTIVQQLLEAYLPFLNKALGVYIPLIVVNCIILGRAEAYAYANPPAASLFDGIGMGLGFSFALTCIGAVRELLGAGKVFGFSVLPASFEPIRIFGQAPGAFLVLACLVALQNFVKEGRKAAGKPYEKIGSGCSEDCMNCADKGCGRRFYDTKAPEEKVREGKAQEAKAREEQAAPAKAREEQAAPAKAREEQAAQTKGQEEQAARTKAREEQAVPTKARGEQAAPAKAREEQAAPAKTRENQAVKEKARGEQAHKAKPHTAKAGTRQGKKPQGRGAKTASETAGLQKEGK